MNLDDFRCMRRGRHISTVSKKNASLLNAVEWRSGKTKRALLLLHGFSSTPAVFKLLLPELGFYDALIAPTLPGHAESLKDFSMMKTAALYQFADEICHELCEEFEQVDVLGLSLGGLLACYLSHRFPLRHLYLLAPATDLHLALDKTITLAKGLMKLGFHSIRNMAGNLYTSQSCDIAFQQLPLITLIELLHFIKSYHFSLPECPTDLFLGNHDEVVSSHCVAARFENCKNTHIHWLKNSAHLLPLDGDISTIVQCIAQNNQL